MSFEEFVDKMKSIQIALLDFLEDESDESEDKFEYLINLISSHKIINDKYEFKALLQLMNNISLLHRRCPNFISKNERLLRHFKKDIQKYFSNSEIFKIFKLNKRILLFLIEEKMMTIDEYIFSQITSKKYAKEKYIEYFQPEIKQFLTNGNIEKHGSINEILQNEEFLEKMNKEVEKYFYEKRREGENDDYLCELIRFNNIEEFITFTEQRNLPLDIEIKTSIFETNIIIFDFFDQLKLIEYASLYGSNDIIKYMQMKGVELTSNIWYSAIHSGNAELIKYLEDNHVSPPDDILVMSVICHHNEISDYIIDNLIKEEDQQNNIDNEYYDKLYHSAIGSCNYCFFPSRMKYKNTFYDLCFYDYYTLVKLYLSEGNIDVNAIIRSLSI